MLAGNFNLTNNPELFEMLVELGNIRVIIPIRWSSSRRSVTFSMRPMNRSFENIEKGNGADSDYEDYRDAGWVWCYGKRRAFDGGYVMAGMLGHGDLFVLRDPAGIRPAFYYEDEEIVAVASERQIKTALNVPLEAIREVEPGHALMVRKDGSITSELINKPLEKKPCSFERIYFRGWIWISIRSESCWGARSWSEC